MLIYRLRYGGVVKTRFALFLLAICCVLPRVALGQTSTPTPTPTLTPTMTPTLDYRTLVMVGMVQLFAGEPPPESSGWLVADGSCVSTVTYARLYAVIGDTFGGCATPPEDDPTFALPDLRGRVPVGSGAGMDLSPRTLGDMFGEENHLLTVGELPSHTHGVVDPGHSHSIARSGSGGSNNPQAASGTVAGAFTTTTNLTGITIDFTGGDDPFNVMQPSLVLHYLIWAGTEGIVIGGSNLPTATPLPQIAVYATVPYEGGGQAVAFTYDVRAGELVIALLLFALLIVLTVSVFRRPVVRD